MFSGIIKTARRQKSFFSEQQPDPYAQMGIDRPGINQQLYNVPPELRPFYMKMFRERMVKAYGLHETGSQRRIS